jgi:hypothetical protein
VRTSRISDHLTNVPIHITCRFNEQDIGIGTAFFYTAGDKHYLITNWHNVSGRRPLDKQPTSKHGAIDKDHRGVDLISDALPFGRALESFLIAEWQMIRP